MGFRFRNRLLGSLHPILSWPRAMRLDDSRLADVPRGLSPWLMNLKELES